MVYLVAGVELSLSLSHVQLRAVITKNLICNSCLVDSVQLVLGVYKFCPKSVGGSQVYLDPRLPDIASHRFGDRPLLWERHAAFD